MKTAHKPLLYIISAVKPEGNKTGGEIILHRHLMERNDFEFKVINVTLVMPRIFRLLEAGRFRTYIKAFSFYYLSFNPEVFTTLAKPDVVITVAHGRECFMAMKAAEFWNVPLVTFFHDWNEALGDVHPRLRFVADRALRGLYKASSLALCVSRQMKFHLGEHESAIVLHPIPSNTTHAVESRPKPDVPSLLYFGYCGGAYLNMLNELMAACQDQRVHLRITGPFYESLKGDYDNVERTGFVGKDSFPKLFEKADILLVLLNFEPGNVKHFSTHFPSKLVEYCGKGKLIGIWGPSYSTGVQWAKETGAAFYYEKNDAVSFIQELLAVYENVETRNKFIRHATEVYGKEFSPEIIHAKFKQAIMSVMTA